MGGGLAGATAAIAARQGGADVILLEALDFTAGNSSLSSGNLLLGGTSVQVTDGIGGALQKMAQAMDDLGVDIRYSTKGVDLVTNESRAVTGVVAVDRAGNEVVYSAPSVVLASGGFTANHDMIVEHWGDDYATLVYGGLKGMDGAMLQAAMKLGAQTVDMDVPHVDATLEVTRAITVTTRMLSDCGGILIRQGTGRRFVDEARDHCEQAATAMHDLGDEYYYEIYDDNAQKVSNGVACTVGGVKVNTSMQALDTNGEPIPGLYVIGEMSGGYLVRYRGGDSLVHSSIQGMLVGQQLAKA